VAPEAKLVPVMVTVVPPVAGPLVGETAVTVGGFAPATYVNWSAAVAELVPPVVATVTWATPEPAGEVAVSEVAEATVTPVAAVDPKWTVAPAAKFVPVTLTVVPPAAGPLLGETAVTVGTDEVAPGDAVRRAPTVDDAEAGDWVDVGVTVPETLGS
jgi:hypothetical protein